MTDTPDTKALREALLPCPFCNSGMSSFAGMTPDAFSKCTDGTLSISCDCGASGPLAPTMEEAIAAWNRRVPLDRSDELDRVKAELERFQVSWASALTSFSAEMKRADAAEYALATALRERDEARRAMQFKYYRPHALIGSDPTCTAEYRALYQHGDVRVVYVNEGEFLMFEAARAALAPKEPT